MSKQQARLKILITNAITAILAVLVFGLTTSYAKTSEPTPFLSPTGGLTPRAWLPIVMNNFPPNPTISRYVANTDLINRTVMDNLGCGRGQAVSTGQNVVVVIDFGYPAYDNTSGQYGANCSLIILSTAPANSWTSRRDSLEGFIAVPPLLSASRSPLESITIHMIQMV